MTKQQTMLRGFAVCDLDELTPDVLHNQVLKASLVSLANCADVEGDLRHELQISARRMAGVSLIRLSAGLFHRVQLSRNTSQYGLLMRVSELVFHALLPDEQGGGSKFQSILEDETRMSSLFEDFLRNFYRSELPGYSAASEIMPWLAKAEDEADLAYLPIMKTDVTLRSGDRTIVADAKYYKEVLAGGRYDAKVRSAHLYQLSTYLAHVREKEPGQEVSGLLIYPSSGRSLRFRYSLLGTPLTVATVDLSAEWPAIHAELIELIARPMGTVTLPKPREDDASLRCRPELA
jgi:5-methylcytosine-specific restriction enzyme subunit McrC